MSWGGNAVTRRASAYAGADAAATGAHRAYAPERGWFGLGAGGAASDCAGDTKTSKRCRRDPGPAWSKEDVRQTAYVPNARNGVVIFHQGTSRRETGPQRHINKVSDAEAVQGDLRGLARGETDSPAWRCATRGRQDPRAHHRPVGEGMRTPTERTEVAFARRRGPMGTLGDPEDLIVR